MSSAGGGGAGPDWACVEVLAEPTRRRIYDAVRDGEGPLTRDDIAQVTGVGRRLAAFHLDRLADPGLLDVAFARPVGRAGGPGAGRPAKRYRPAPTQIDVSMPPRRYDLAARILATAVAESPAASDVAALEVAEREGERIGAA